MKPGPRWGKQDWPKKKRKRKARASRKRLYGKILKLYEEGKSYREGAAILNIPVGTFSGTIYKVRRNAYDVKRSKYIDQSHRVTSKEVTLPRLKFMED
jgi:hypothetical protein